MQPLERQSRHGVEHLLNTNNTTPVMNGYGYADASVNSPADHRAMNTNLGWSYPEYYDARMSSTPITGRLHQFQTWQTDPTVPPPQHNHATIPGPEAVWTNHKRRHSETFESSEHAKRPAPAHRLTNDALKPSMSPHPPGMENGFANSGPSSSNARTHPPPHPLSPPPKSFVTSAGSLSNRKAAPKKSGKLTPTLNGGGGANGVDPKELTPVNKDGLVSDLQHARCMSNRYRHDVFPRCISCTRRWAGDVCRFQGIRLLLKNSDGRVKDFTFIGETHSVESPDFRFPTTWNRALTDENIRRTKIAVAHSLLPTLLAEREHIKQPELICRPRETDVRATCDTCMTSLSSCSWLCTLCGKEACADCFENVKRLTASPLPSSSSSGSIKPVQHHVNPFFLLCTKRNEHSHEHFLPVTRFVPGEVEQAITEMEEVLREDEQAGDNLAVLTTAAYESTPQYASAPSRPVANPASSTPPIRELQMFDNDTLTESDFRRIWMRGEPILVSGIHRKISIAWTPEYFIEKYGYQNVRVHECRDESNKKMDVEAFFQQFGKYEGRKEILKLKDWPTKTDFKSAFPVLFEDFANAICMPNYTRRDGVLNLASHFPSNAIGPDLGPKMYNAFASHDKPGTKGSTRLHMDMSDAVNLMVYSAPPPPPPRPTDSLKETAEPPSEGTALWDIFSASDTPALRHFLLRTFPNPFSNSKTKSTDPIHTQQFYLDSSLKAKLFAETGVRPWTFQQRVGQAIFIPAGCAHQVCNLADSIKVAIDFVSPENVGRCETLTKEFREQNQSKVWKEDVLQLRNMLWFAWLSCRKQEQEREKNGQ